MTGLSCFFAVVFSPPSLPWYKKRCADYKGGLLQLLYAEWFVPHEVQGKLKGEQAKLQEEAKRQLTARRHSPTRPSDLFLLGLFCGLFFSLCCLFPFLIYGKKSPIMAIPPMPNKQEDLRNDSGQRKEKRFSVNLTDLYSYLLQMDTAISTTQLLLLSFRSSD